MDPSSWVLLSAEPQWGAVAVAFVLIALNALYVAGEFALVKVPRARLEEQVAAGKMGARWALEANHKMDAYLSLCQIGITLASLALGWIGEPAFEGIVRPPLEWVLGLFGVEPASGVVTLTALIFAFGTISFLHVVVGEQLPKMLAITRSKGTLLWTAGPMKLTNYLLFPAVWVLKGATNVLLGLVGVDESEAHDVIHTEDELLKMVTASTHHGLLQESEKAIIHRAFKFHERQVEDIMVPRPAMICLDFSRPLEQAWETIRSGEHSRYPVLDGSFQKVLGMIHVRDLVAPPEGGTIDLRSRVRRVAFVPETASIDTLLQTFQKRRTHLALVVDEYGAVSGLVTLEDVIEEIVGEIYDEFDTTRALLPGSGMGWVTPGRTPLVDAEKHLGVELEVEGAHTVAGLILSQMGRIPQEGDAATLAGYSFEVVRMEGPRIDEVRVVPLIDAESAEAENDEAS